jgi:hypothetical protein
VKTWRLPGTDDSMAYEQGAAYVGDFPHGQLLRVTVQHGLQDLRSTRGPDAIIAATPGALWTSTAAGKLLRLTLPTSQRRRGLP